MKFHFQESRKDTILTTAAWTHVHGDANVILLGNVAIDSLLIAMKEQLPFVRTKTKVVFEKEIIAS